MCRVELYTVYFHFYRHVTLTATVCVRCALRDFILVYVEWKFSLVATVTERSRHRQPSLSNRVHDVVPFRDLCAAVQCAAVILWLLPEVVRSVHVANHRGAVFK